MKSNTQNSAVNTLLLEVDDAMRWDRLEKLWKSYGNHLLGFIGLTILATALFSGWNAWNHHINVRNTNDLLTLLEDKNFPANIKPDEIKLKGSLRGIAFINAGSAYLKKDKKEDALKFYTLATQEKTSPPEIRSLALMMQARLTGADGKADIDTLLQSILKSKKNPWRHEALMEAAAFAAQKNDFAKARTYLKEILNDKNALQGLKIKADALDRLYASKTKAN